MTGGFLALLDDITMLLDDTAAVSKMAMKKTAGILGDDLAVNAEKAAKGFSASRELPVIWKITKGSIINKIILLPIILALSYYFPIMINPILFLGALYLAYEGAEKCIEYSMNIHHQTEKKKEFSEKEKIKSAIFTDFILSIEIILITLSSVSGKPFIMQVFVLSLVSLCATIFVYGLVAFIVRLDDNGLALINFVSNVKRNNNELSTFAKKILSILNSFGVGLVLSMPVIIKVLTVIGTIAMLLVSGGILSHMFHININFLNINLNQYEYYYKIIEFFIAFNLGSFSIFINNILLKKIKLFIKR